MTVKQITYQNLWPRIDSLIKTARSVDSKNRPERNFFFFAFFFSDSKNRPERNFLNFATWGSSCEILEIQC